jgi:hypothetical protein
MAIPSPAANPDKPTTLMNARLLMVGEDDVIADVVSSLIFEDIAQRRNRA